MSDSSELLDVNAISADLDALVAGWAPDDEGFALLGSLVARIRSCPALGPGDPGSTWNALRFNTTVDSTAIYAFRAGDLDVGVRGMWEGERLEGIWLRTGQVLWGLQGETRWSRRYDTEESPASAMGLPDELHGAPGGMLDEIKTQVDAETRKLVADSGPAG